MTSLCYTVYYVSFLFILKYIFHLGLITKLSVSTMNINMIFYFSTKKCFWGQNQSMRHVQKDAVKGQMTK